MAQSPTATITTTVITALQRILTGSHAVAAVAGLALVIIAGAIAPGDDPGIWVWVRLLTAACSAGIALAVIDVSRDPNHAAQGQPGYLLVAGVFLLLTLLISVTFTTLTALFGLLVIGLVLLHLHAHGPSSLPVLWALLGMLIPFWVWSAFDAWDRLLLLLLPLGLVGIISLEHALRADLYGDSVTRRSAAWIGILGMAAVLLITAMAGSIERSWIASGAMLVALFALLDLLPARRSRTDTVPSITLPAAALLVLMLTWLVAL